MAEQDTPDLTDAQWEFLGQLPATTSELADHFGVQGTTIEGYRERIKNKGVELDWDPSTYEWDYVGDLDIPQEFRTYDTPPWEDTPVADEEPDEGDLTERERYILHELQTGADEADLAEDIGEREEIVHEHLRTLRADGWEIYRDDTAGHVTIEGDHVLRSSEHKGTRTRKANRWWELTHNQIERQWKALNPTPTTLIAEPGNEDWVTHLTDLHAGDVVRDYAGDIVYQTDDIPGVVEYITQQSIALAEKHNATYDTAHLLYGGDLVTNEAIYQGQFEDLDAWLDEQADVIQQALIEQIYTFSEHFDAVQVVGQIGNHGANRANGTSKHNNADLLIYKHLRNYITKVQERHDGLTNVSIKIGEARPYTPVRLRGGKIHGHLRHGQDRKPQADTSARLKEWLSTLLDTINSSWGAFDVVWMGHHHVSGRVPWNGPPIIVSGSPKPGGDYVEKLGVKGSRVQPDEIGHCHGVSDEGITSIWPIDTRHYEPASNGKRDKAHA